jgi:NADPH:quinone reductase-like Zn-dependent oxidoreductase
MLKITWYKLIDRRPFNPKEELMEAYEIQGSFGLGNLKRVQRPIPNPGPGQILVRLGAASLNFRDLMTIKGLYNPKQPLPLVPCSDGAGTVVALGSGVLGFQEGQRVMGCFSQKWIAGTPTAEARAATLGGPLDGTLAEYVLLGEAGALSTPDHLSDEEAATLPCAAVTAWNALVTMGRLKAGDTVLVQGTGGVSIFALQFAKLCGARVVITSSSDDKLQTAIALGADATVNYRSEPDWPKAVKQITGGRGADHIVEVGGAGTLAGSLGCVALGGTISVIGVLSGAAAQLDVRAVLMKGARIQGIFVGPRDVFETMVKAMEIHQMRPAVGRVFPFEEAVDALRTMESGAHFGKIVVRLAGG